MGGRGLMGQPASQAGAERGGRDGRDAHDEKGDVQVAEAEQKRGQAGHVQADKRAEGKGSQNGLSAAQPLPARYRLHLC